MELAHTIKLSMIASWQTGAPGRMMVQPQSECQGLAPRRASSPIVSPSLKAGEEKCTDLMTVRHLPQPYSLLRPTHLGREFFLTQSISSNLIQKHPDKHIQNNVEPNTWTPHDHIKLTREINHHRCMTTSPRL